jgi:LacI family transcriptional regulator
MSLRQVAQEAKVSLCTASMALRDHHRISEKTRQRVRAVAKRLGYRADAKIAELMNRACLNRTGQLQACLGVISFYDTATPWKNSQHLQRIYSAMTARAGTLGYRLEPCGYVRRE